MTNAPSQDELVELFQRMVVVRRLEEKLGELHRQGRTRGPIHRCDGQEAAGIGATAVLETGDVATSTHRGHAHYVGKGLDLRRIVAEIFGRATGYCRGRAGHMLIADRASGMLGGNAIVGGGMPIAVGQALALKAQGRGRVVATFFGDGAAQTGVCHESMNMAALWKLPLVFFCEHNQYGLTVHSRFQSSIEDLHRRAAGYGIPGAAVDGNDVVAVYRVMGEAVARARAGDGPTFIEAKTYRMTGFSTSDMGGYQSDEEMDAWRPRDPIVRTRALLERALGAEAVAAVETKAGGLVEQAFEQALSDPMPGIEDLADGEYGSAA